MYIYIIWHGLKYSSQDVTEFMSWEKGLKYIFYDTAHLRSV